METRISLFTKLLLVCFLSFFFNAGANDSSKADSINLGSDFVMQFDKIQNAKRGVMTDTVEYLTRLAEVEKLKYEVAKQMFFEKKYSDYYVNALQQRKEIFDWHLQSTKMIFVLVVIIVLAGLVFSGIQFYSTLKSDKVIKEGDDGLRTELELSVRNGVKISSSVVGLIILVISIAFFFFYLKYVYPINQENIDNSASKPIEYNIP